MHRSSARACGSWPTRWGAACCRRTTRRLRTLRASWRPTSSRAPGAWPQRSSALAPASGTALDLPAPCRCLVRPAGQLACRESVGTAWLCSWELGGFGGQDAGGRDRFQGSIACEPGPECCSAARHVGQVPEQLWLSKPLRAGPTAGCWRWSSWWLPWRPSTACTCRWRWRGPSCATRARPAGSAGCRPACQACTRSSRAPCRTRVCAGLSCEAGAAITQHSPVDQIAVADSLDAARGSGVDRAVSEQQQSSSAAQRAQRAPGLHAHPAAHGRALALPYAAMLCELAWCIFMQGCTSC